MHKTDSGGKRQIGQLDFGRRIGGVDNCGQHYPNRPPQGPLLPSPIQTLIWTRLVTNALYTLTLCEGGFDLRPEYIDPGSLGCGVFGPAEREAGASLGDPIGRNLDLGRAGQKEPLITQGISAGALGRVSSGFGTIAEIYVRHATLCDKSRQPVWLSLVRAVALKVLGYA